MFSNSKKQKMQKVCPGCDELFLPEEEEEGGILCDCCGEGPFCKECVKTYLRVNPFNYSVNHIECTKCLKLYSSEDEDSDDWTETKISREREQEQRIEDIEDEYNHFYPSDTVYYLQVYILHVF